MPPHTCLQFPATRVHSSVWACSLPNDGVPVLHAEHPQPMHRRAWKCVNLSISRQHLDHWGRNWWVNASTYSPSSHGLITLCTPLVRSQQNQVHGSQCCIHLLPGTMYHINPCIQLLAPLAFGGLQSKILC